MQKYERIPSEFEEDFPLLPQCFDLTGSERIILNALRTSSQPVSLERLTNALSLTATSNTIEALVSYLRLKVEPLGWRIVFVRKQGYKLLC